MEDNRRLAAELSGMRATISDRLNGVGAEKAAVPKAAAPAPRSPPMGPPPGWERHVVAPPLATVVPPARPGGRPPK